MSNRWVSEGFAGYLAALTSPDPVVETVGEVSTNRTKRSTETVRVGRCIGVGRIH